METLVANLKLAMGDRIRNNAWMAPETKAAAFSKLEKMDVMVGYPDKWRDYSGLKIDPADLYGEPASSFKMAWWDPTQGAYDLYPSPLSAVERGKGYFVKFAAERELSRSGEPADPAVRNQPFEIPETELEKAKAGHYTYELDVVTKSPSARVAIGIWDERSNEAGFALVTPSSRRAADPTEPRG